MFMNVTCPTCAHRCQLPENVLGQAVQCPGCAGYFRCGTVSPPSLVTQPLGPAAPAVQATPHVRAAPVQAEPTVHYRCVRCAHPLESPARTAGSKINCPGCGQRLQIPQAASAAPQVPVHTVAPTPPPVLRPAAPAPVAPAAAPAARVESCLECGVDVSQRPRVQTCPDCGSLFCSARCYRDHRYHAHPRSRG